MRPLLRSVTVVATATLLLVGCSQVRGAIDEALSAALRSTASATLKNAAEARGFPLKADPSCSGGVKTGESSANIDCTAETQSGLPVSGKVTIANAGKPNCSGSMVITIGTQPPFTQQFANCGN